MYINATTRMVLTAKRRTGFFSLCNNGSVSLFLLFSLLLLVLTSAACSEKKISISLTTMPAEIDFGSSQSIIQFSISNSHVDPLAWVISANQSWISFSETKGIVSKAPHKISIQIDRTNLLPGKKQAEIKLVYRGGQQIIPVSVFVVSQSETPANLTTNVKKNQKNSVESDLTEHDDKNKLSPPNNTTAVNFIDSGALETNVKTVTLNISAEDDVGIAGYYINDSDTKEQTLIGSQSKEDWNWKTINEDKRYKGVISYNFKHDYRSGEEVYVNVWFKDVEGGISSAAQDSIVFVNAQVQQNNELMDSQANSREKQVVPLSEDLAISQRSNEDLSSTGGVNALTQRGGQANFAVDLNPNKQQNNNSGNKNKKKKVDESVIYAYGFENGYNGWWVDNGQWEIGRSSVRPKESCYKSIQCAGTVLSGPYSDYVESRLISPAITIPELSNSERVQFKFVHWYALHLGDLAKLQISVEMSPGAWSNWKTLSVQSGFSRQWRISASGLSNYAKKTIRLGFYLYQPPDKAGVKDGWYIDDISIVVVR